MEIHLFHPLGSPVTSGPRAQGPCAPSRPQGLGARLLRAAITHPLQDVRPQHSQRVGPLPPLLPQRAHVSQATGHNGRSLATGGAVGAAATHIPSLLSITPTAGRGAGAADVNGVHTFNVGAGCEGGTVRRAPGGRERGGEARTSASLRYRPRAKGELMKEGRSQQIHPLFLFKNAHCWAGLVIPGPRPLLLAPRTPRRQVWARVPAEAQASPSATPITGARGPDRPVPGPKSSSSLSLCCRVCDSQHMGGRRAGRPWRTGRPWRAGRPWRTGRPWRAGRPWRTGVRAEQGVRAERRPQQSRPHLLCSV